MKTKTKAKRRRFYERRERRATRQHVHLFGVQAFGTVAELPQEEQDDLAELLRALVEERARG